ncbi:hypothetical protein DIU31_009555 [Mucilaginibacter rubeus]|uniref:Uncharacterized protein n=1 Tax=Mucilaginibacter rubeus TaxID=2027860 RepID=A0AAE6JDW4_9SPHI|nr:MULTISPECIES: hypothetical protein [Mucilaginibacter]QEM03745.1 hypothetical protein DIU31_009555 [Mucilaginibacter rubeus]QEM16356.1 hypothetical protein DIU38_009650 [Mucilaginibacter gossypii]QTE38546.1 hypothetical protein J3L18_05570 [Mucilaginibacter gossypii]QTE40876.1 hypothetical protein J3L19_18105 [Mucilaginibacter rubeus]QTE47479.1 hypothetical protein J3L21_18080 [Mucilaginibacter rubeus]
MKTKKKEKKTVAEAPEGHDHHETYLEEEMPNPDHEFPGVGRVVGDFVTRDHGRSSHRMIDHEPGIF